MQSDSDGTGGPGVDPPSASADPSDPDGVDNLPVPLQEALKQTGVPPDVVQTTVRAFASHYSGPLPPAEQMRAYEDVLPGSADRILRMAERQQDHRHDLERMTVKEATNRSWWGLRLGFVITVLVVGVGAATILTGHSAVGLALVLADLAVLAGVFVYGRVEQRKERVEKDRQTRAISTGPQPRLGPTGPQPVLKPGDKQ